MEATGPVLLLLLSLSSIIISSPVASSLLVIDMAEDTNDGSIPTETNIPTTARPMPTALATQMPLDHIFSPKIIPANKPIQSKFIQPSATIRRKYAQQQPRQYN